MSCPLTFQKGFSFPLRLGYSVKYRSHYSSEHWIKTCYTLFSSHQQVYLLFFNLNWNYFICTFLSLNLLIQFLSNPNNVLNSSWVNLFFSLISFISFGNNNHNFFYKFYFSSSNIRFYFSFFIFCTFPFLLFEIYYILIYFYDL